MNRTILFCCAICSVLFASAQTLVKEMDNAATRFIPGQYMSSGEAAIYFSFDEYGYSNDEPTDVAQIYDFELNDLKTIYFRMMWPYSVIEERSSSGISVERTRYLGRETGEIIDLPPVSDMEARKEAFIRKVYDDNFRYFPSMTIEGLASSCWVQDETTICIMLPLGSSPGMYQFQEYLTHVAIRVDSSGAVGYTYKYAITVPCYDGYWSSSTVESAPVRNLYIPRCNDVVRMNHWNGGVYLPFSQTFFNDDEKFEYVRYRWELKAAPSGNSDMSIAPDGSVDPLEYLFGITTYDRDGDGEEDYRRTDFSIRYTAIEVVDEDGTVIYTFPLPDNCDSNAGVEFFKSDNSILAQVWFSGYNDNNEYIQTVRFYRIDKSTGVATIVREESHLSVFPNPACKGAPVEMVLPTGSDAAMVSVTSLDGTRIFSQPVAHGADRVSVPTDTLLPGVYLFTLSERGRTVETVKVIIR